MDLRSKKWERASDTGFLCKATPMAASAAPAHTVGQAAEELNQSPGPNVKSQFPNPIYLFSNHPESFQLSLDAASWGIIDRIVEIRNLAQTLPSY